MNNYVNLRRSNITTFFELRNVSEMLNRVADSGRLSYFKYHYGHPIYQVIAA